MNIVLSELQKLCRIAYRWWIDRLGDAGVSVITNIAPSILRPLLIHVSQTRIQIIDTTNSSAPLLQILREDARQIAPSEATEPLQRAFARHRRITMLISSDQAMIRNVTLPIAAAPHVDSAIQLQLEQLLPMHPRSLVIDHTLVEADVKQNLLCIELAAIKRADLVHLVEKVQCWGLRVASVHLADSPDSPPRFRFELPNTSPPPWLKDQRVNRFQLIAASTLIALCILISIIQTLRADHALNAAILDIQPRAQEILAKRERVAKQLAILSTIEKRASNPAGDDILTEVTTLLPADSWLTNFEYKSGHLRAIGFSSNAELLTRLLAQSPKLTSVQLLSSGANGSAASKDRFVIEAQIVTEVL